MWILLYNPTSGGGKGQREARRVTAFFRERGADLVTVSGSSLMKHLGYSKRTSKRMRAEFRALSLSVVMK